MQISKGIKKNPFEACLAFNFFTNLKVWQISVYKMAFKWKKLTTSQGLDNVV